MSGSLLKVWQPAVGLAMRRRVAVRQALFLLFCSSTFLSSLSLAADQPNTLLERKEAAAWLSKIHRAAQRENYVGTLTFQRDGNMYSSRIQHYSDLLNNEYERLEMLDGKQREVLRHNDVVHNVVNEAKVVVVERQEGKDRFPALLATNKGDVLDQYDMRRLGIERVAGMECEMFALEPRDALRYAYRVWADKDSGLLIRAQTLGENNKVLEQVAFSQVEIGVPSGKQRILTALKNLNSWNHFDVTTQPAKLTEAGWVIPAAVKGFQKIREVRRPLGTARNADGKPAFEVQQVVFSDGLAGLSVFIEPVSDKRTRNEGVISQGATHVMVRRLADYWITVVGEVPATTIKQFASSIEYRPAPKPQ